MRTRCPVCGCLNSEILYDIPYLDIDSNIQLVSIKLCEACNFIFKDIIEKDFVLDVKNGNTNRFDYNTSSIVTEYQKKEIHYLKGYINGTEKILDIGCNDGSLLKMLKDKYPEVSCYGIEISEVCCNVCEKNKINIIKGSIYDEIKFLEGEFDLVILSQVLEHLPDLHMAVSHINSFLKDGGKVLISVPDDGNIKSLSGNMPSILSLEHLNHFSERTLNRLFINMNFERLSKKTIPIENGNFHIIAALFQKIADPAVEGIKMTLKNFGNERKQLKEYYQQQLGDSPYVIWGASHMAMNFLGDILNRKTLKYIVDVDPVKQGGSVGGVEVKSPQNLFSDPDYKILVLPIVFEKEILKIISENNYPNDVVMWRRQTC